MPRRFYRRFFLNERYGGSAHMMMEVYAERFRSGAHSNTAVSTTFEVSDCNRIVNLDFGVWDDGDNWRESLDENRIKLGRLVYAVNEFAEKLTEAYDWMEEERDRRDAATS
jgi:hypothetical protein